MRTLPLYPEPPSYSIDTAAPATRTPNCTGCALHKSARAVCRGFSTSELRKAKDGVLVLFSTYPGTNTASFVKQTMARAANAGPALLDAAVRCSTGGAVPSIAVDACRGFTAAAIADMHPSRVVVVGQEAARMVLGEVPAELDSVARGYAFTAHGLMVFLLPELDAGNRFARAQWADDLLWCMTATVRPPPLSAVVHVVESVEDARAAVAYVSRARFVAWDVETFGRPFDKAFRILSAALCAAGSDDAYVWPRIALERADVRGPLLEVLADEDVEKAAMNGKYDAVCVRAAWDADVACMVRDIGLRRSVLDVEARTRLEYQQWFVGMGGGKSEMAKARAAAGAAVRKALQVRESAQQGLFARGVDPLLGADVRHVVDNVRAYDMAFVPDDLLWRYNAKDAVSTARIDVVHERTMVMPAHAPVRHVWESLVRDMPDAVAQVEAWGVPVSRDALLAFTSYVGMMQSRQTQVLATHGLDRPGSSPAVAEFLYGKLNLPVLKHTEDGAPSTSEDALAPLEARHPVVPALLEWRRLDKLRGTYGEGLSGQLADDGRIHVDLRIDGARTGRMSAGGGLHGIPRPESEEGKMVRDLFVALPGYDLLELDLSQAELRVLAGLSGDKVMGDTFRAGVDIHQRSAELVSRRVWHVDPDKVQKKHRTQAKTINLAIAYGRGDVALAAEVTVKSGVHCTPEQAAAIKEAIMGQFKDAARWLDEQAQFCRMHGYSRTWFMGAEARRRPLWDIAMDGDTETARKRRGEAVRAARNGPVQGTTSDLVAASLVQAVRWLKRERIPAQLGLTVHDSLLFHVRQDWTERVARHVKAIMESWPMGGVPMVADVKCGPAWGSLKEWHG